MKKTTTGHRHGIQWTLTSQLEDLDFADDIALLSHSHDQMQRKMDLLSQVSSGTGLHINEGKSKVLRINACDAPITLQGSPLEEVESFIYFGSVISKQGGTDEDIKVRIQKARLRIFKTNVKSGTQKKKEKLSPSLCMELRPGG